ncbi:MAG: hypothetical protein Kow0022_16570 [Phycisphaerales bacterium]
MTDLHRRDLLTRALALGAASTLSSLLSACGSSPRRTGGLVGTPIPENPPPATGRPAPRIMTGPNRGLGPTGLPAGVIPRTQWAKFGPDVSLAEPMGYIDRITVHHDGMPPTYLRGMDQCARQIETIRRGHRSNGWADIGYHYVIDPDGRIWEGRPIQLQGAHVRAYNPHNMGILVLGNFDEQQPTPQALAALDAFVAMQMYQYGIPLNRVFTHQELAATACPGRNLQRYMERTRSRGGVLASA